MRSKQWRGRGDRLAQLVYTVYRLSIDSHLPADRLAGCLAARLPRLQIGRQLLLWVSVGPNGAAWVKGFSTLANAIAILIGVRNMIREAELDTNLAGASSIHQDDRRPNLEALSAHFQSSRPSASRPDFSATSRRPRERERGSAALVGAGEAG